MIPVTDLEVGGVIARENGYSRPMSIGAMINFDDFGKGTLRLFEHLGLGDLKCNNNFLQLYFPYQLLSYNAIYEYYFRNDEYEKFDNSILT